VTFVRFQGSKSGPETKIRNGLCGSHLLGEGDEHSCSDLLKNGAQWRDKYDQTCENYVKMEEWKSGIFGGEKGVRKGPDGFLVS